MKICEKCGRFKGKSVEHICPTKVWNKGLVGMQEAWNKGKLMTDETKERLSKALKGREVWNKGLKGGQVAWNKGLHINLNPNGFI